MAFYWSQRRGVMGRDDLFYSFDVAAAMLRYTAFCDSLTEVMMYAGVFVMHPCFL
jgi:hypothetical protein